MLSEGSKGQEEDHVRGVGRRTKDGATSFNEFRAPGKRANSIRN